MAFRLAGITVAKRDEMEDEKAARGERRYDDDAKTRGRVGVVARTE